MIIDQLTSGRGIVPCKWRSLLDVSGVPILSMWMRQWRVVYRMSSISPCNTTRTSIERVEESSPNGNSGSKSITDNFVSILLNSPDHLIIEKE